MGPAIHFVKLTKSVLLEVTGPQPVMVTVEGRLCAKTIIGSFMESFQTVIQVAWAQAHTRVLFSHWIGSANASLDPTNSGHKRSGRINGKASMGGSTQSAEHVLRGYVAQHG